MSSDFPAFPRPWSQDKDGYVYEAAQEGISTRDYFAAKCMQGLCANPDGSYFLDAPLNYKQKVARVAYEMADAMLKERDRQ
jgi:hypothetical protein